MYRKYGKNIFDFFFALMFSIVLSPLILLLIILTSVDTQSWGIFTQTRIGRFAKPFTIYKLKTIHPQTQNISKLGSFFRITKLDELPQLYNILLGKMSFVGPRPDVPGYYDLLEGKERKILQLKPGLTSEAGIKYRNEDDLLNILEDSLKYNDEVLFPDKVKMNLDYLEKQSFMVDVKIIFKTMKSFYD